MHHISEVSRLSRKFRLSQLILLSPEIYYPRKTLSLVSGLVDHACTHSLRLLRKGYSLPQTMDQYPPSPPVPAFSLPIEMELLPVPQMASPLRPLPGVGLRKPTGS